MVKIVGIVIGILLVVFGLYYVVAQKDQDSEQKKIYLITAVIGVVIAAFAFFVL